MANCIDLKEKFGQRYRVVRSEPGDTRGRDPWLLAIPCRHGHIYPQGRELLAASTNNRGPIARRLAALPCCRVVQDGDDGINAVFDANDFASVAAVMRPNRRRQLSAEHKARLVAAGQAALGRKSKSDVDSEARRRDAAA